MPNDPKGTTMTQTTCTHGPSAVTGQRCGQPAVATFTGSDGQAYAECAEHAVVSTVCRAAHSGRQVGDAAIIRRHGQDYVGQVVRVTRSGKVYARVTYANGASRVVEV